MSFIVATEEKPFTFKITLTHPRLIDIEYVGHMPAELSAHIEQTEQMVRDAREPVGLCYAVRGFTSFHRSQVTKHGALFLRLGKLVSGIAVVGARPVVAFGATTVALISSTPLETFAERSEAIRWLESLRSSRA